MLENSTEAGPRQSSAFSDNWFAPGRVALLLASLIVCSFPKVLLGWQTFFYRDFGVLAYPVIFHHHESFWRGEWPLWNPLSNCGAPFLAQWGTMVLYPFSIFYLLFPLPWSINFFCLAHLFWAGWGMYYLAERWARHRFAACAAAVAFVFNGVTFSSLIWPNYAVALGWMPWVVLCAEKAWRQGGRQIVIASLVAVLQMLSGVPEVVLLTWLLIAGTWVGTFLQKDAPVKLLMGRTLVVITLTSGLIAAQLWPFLDLLAHSQRTLNFGTSKWAMPAWGWANFLVPLFRCFLTPQGIFFQHGQEFMSSTYPGIGVVMFALMGALFVRQRRVWLLGLAAAVSVIMAMGEGGLLYNLLRRAIPLTGFARYPIKFVVLTAFALPILAAYAVNDFGGLRFSTSDRRWRRLVAIGLGLIAAIAVVLWFAQRYPLPLDQWPATLRNGIWRGIFLIGILTLFAVRSRVAQPNVAALGVILLLVLDFWTHAPPQNPTLPSSAMAPGLWQLSNQRPAPAHGEGRIVISPQAEQQLLMSRVADLQNDFLGKRLALWSNLNMLEGIPKIGGSATLQLREQMEVQTLLYASTNTELPRLADFLGASLATAPGQILEWSRRESYLPLVTFGQKPIFADATDTLSALTNSAFNPSEVVYLPAEAERWVTATNRSTGSIAPRKFSMQRIELKIDAAQVGLVVIAQSFYHPWRAYVDGKATPIWRANHAFQAVEIPAGSHEVKLVYEDWRFNYGAMISLGTLLLCTVLCFRWISSIRK